MSYLSSKDANQCIRAAFNDDTGKLMVDASFSGELTVNLTDENDSVAIGDGTNTLAVNVDGSINTTIVGPVALEIDASSDSIAISDGTDTLLINADGSINVNTGLVEAELSEIQSNTQEASDFLSDITDITSNLLTDSQLRASPVPVDVTFPATQPVSGTVAVSNFPASQAVTGTFFQATQPVSAVSLPLPSGASTEAKQDLLFAELQLKADLTETQPVSVATLPLPSGAATSANQATEITSLQILDDVPSSMNGAFVKGVPVMGQLDDSGTTAATEDNVAPVRITAQRALHNNLRNNSGVEIGTSTTPLIANSTNITGGSDLSALTLGNKLYSASIDLNAATAGVNNPLILFRNPNASGKTVYIYRVDFGTNVSNVNIEAKIFSTPTVTVNGSAITTGTRHIGGGVSAVSLLTSLPTVSSSGVQLETSVQGTNANTSILAGNFSIVIDPNNAVLITANPLSNNRNVAITVIWAEI